MNFAPKTEKQLAEERLIPSGTYPFEVITSEAKKSKAGNDMIELGLRVFMPDGTSRQLTDWIMEKMAFKLFHFCSYTGLGQQYEAGTLTADDCQGRSGYVKVGIQSDKKGEFPDRNNVVDYMRSLDGKMPAGGIAKPQPTEAQMANQDGASSEDVPF